MKKTLAILVTLCLLCGISLTACGGGGAPSTAAPADSSAAAPEDSGAAAPTDAGGESITLNFMHTRTAEDVSQSAEGQAFVQNLEAWKAANPNVTINETTMVQTDYEMKITSQAAAGDMPDLFFTKGSRVGSYFRGGLMADLTSYINADEYRPAIFDPFIRDGKIYAMPYQCNVTHLVFYNEELWSAAGFDTFPTTWEELDQAKTYFDGQGISTFSFGNLDKWPSESCIISALGDRIHGTDWTNSIVANDGVAKFTDPQFIETMYALNNMTKYINPDFNSITDSQATALYIGGRSAATINGIWTVSNIITNDPDKNVVDKTKVAVLPGFPDGLGSANSTSGGPVWAQSVSSKLEGAALEAAVDLTLALYAPSYSQYVMDNAGQVSIHIVEPTDPAALSPIAKSTLDTVNSLDGLTPIYDAVMEASVIDVMNSNLQSMMNGDITPEAVAELIQAEQDKLSAA